MLINNFYIFNQELFCTKYFKTKYTDIKRDRKGVVYMIKKYRTNFIEICHFLATSNYFRVRCYYLLKYNFFIFMFGNLLKRTLYFLRLFDDMRRSKLEILFFYTRSVDIFARALLGRFNIELLNLQLKQNKHPLLTFPMRKLKFELR